MLLWDINDIYNERTSTEKRKEKKEIRLIFPRQVAGIHECIPHVIPFRRESYECVKSETLALSVYKL